MSEDKASNSTDQDNSDTADEATGNQNKVESVVARSENKEADSGNDEQSAKTERDAKSKPKRQRKSASKRAFPWISVTILLVIIVLAAGNYWQFQQGQILKQSQAKFAEQLANATQSIESLDSEINETSQQQKSLVQKTQQSEQNQQTMQATLEQMSQQLKELAIEKGKEPLFWRVSEVEYLLSVANHRLILEKDVATAKTALEDADNRLKAIGDPGLIPVRNTLANEINLLEQVKLPDIAGMASQLESMSATIDKLVFVKSAHSLESINKSKTGFADDGDAVSVGQFIEKIVNMFFTINRTDEPIEPLLPPEEKQFLKHNLNLKIEEARIALLNKQAELFQQNIDTIEQWTQKYFDMQDPSVANLMQTVAELKKVDLQPELPDISNSLRNLRTWMSQHKRVAYKALTNISKLPGASLAKNNDFLTHKGTRR